MLPLLGMAMAGDGMVGGTDQHGAITAARIWQVLGLITAATKCAASRRLMACAGVRCGSAGKPGGLIGTVTMGSE